MASDQLVSAKHILRTIGEVQRRGIWRMIADLEKVEPELAEHLMEMLSTIHQQLVDAGVSPRKSRTIDLTLQEMAVVCITSLRVAHFELWRDMSAGDRLSAIDPSLAAPTPPASPPPSCDGPSGTRPASS